MYVEELNREQLIELKQAYLCEMYEQVYTTQLADVDELVSDEEIFAAYGDYVFSEEDFLCSCR